MANTISIVFSIVALVCGITASFWIFKLREEFISEQQTTYALSSLIASSFLISYPLWTLFSEFFTFTSVIITRISYLLFSMGYFGVLLVAYLSVARISSMRERIEDLEKLSEKANIPKQERQTISAKIRELRKASRELEQYQKFSSTVESRMKELEQQLKRLKNNQKPHPQEIVANPQS